MFFINPTIQLGKLIRLCFGSFSEEKLKQDLRDFFFYDTVLLTDSGRSALAAIIISLGLEGKTIALPAYICDVLYPILTKYNISPIFLDVNTQTFQPDLSEYKKRIHRNVDAVLLCHTYGKKVPSSVYTYLQNKNIKIIEDCAHCVDFTIIKPKNQEKLADAIYFSLPKICPAPNGGIALIRKSKGRVHIGKDTIHISHIKQILHILPSFHLLILFIKRVFRINNLANPIFSSIKKPWTISLKIFHNHLPILLKKGIVQNFNSFPYCFPIMQKDPIALKKKLQKHGIFAERIWNDPITHNPGVQKKYDIHTKDFPHTKEIAKTILCLPLRNIKNNAQLKKYTQKLQHLLPKDSTHIWNNPQR